MSIIQEALKKNQGYRKLDSLPPKEERPLDRESTKGVGLPKDAIIPSDIKIRIFEFFFLLSIILFLINIGQFLMMRSASPKADDAQKGKSVDLLKDEPAQPPAKNTSLQTKRVVAPRIEDIRKTEEDEDESSFAEIVRTISLPQIQHEYPKFILNGIMYMESGSHAIINRSVVKEGDVVNGAKVIRIDKNTVTLNLKGNDVTLRLM